MKEGIKNLKNSTINQNFNLIVKQGYCIAWSLEK